MTHAELLDAVEVAPLAELARIWVVACDRLLGAAPQERAAAWRGAADIADRNLVASGARRDQIEAALRSLNGYADHLRRELGEEEEE